MRARLDPPGPLFASRAAVGLPASEPAATRPTLSLAEQILVIVLRLPVTRSATIAANWPGPAPRRSGHTGGETAAAAGAPVLRARADPPLGTAVVSSSGRPATVQIRTFGRAGSLVRAIRIPVLAVAGDSIGGVSETRTRPLPAGDSVGVAA
jgi:hypothetical protein